MLVYHKCGSSQSAFAGSFTYQCSCSIVIYQVAIDFNANELLISRQLKTVMMYFVNINGCNLTYGKSICLSSDVLLKYTIINTSMTYLIEIHCSTIIIIIIIYGLTVSDSDVLTSLTMSWNSIEL